MRRFRNILLTAAMVLAGTFVTPAAAAFASNCDAVGDVYYSFTSVTTSHLLSNLRSDYLVGPGSITYSRSTTAEVSASMTASVSAEAGIVFAKASVSLGVTVGASWSATGTWSYTKSVPKGTTARLVMWHDSRSFVVTKTRMEAPCKAVVIYKTTVNAPLKSSINVWNLQNL